MCCVAFAAYSSKELALAFPTLLAGSFALCHAVYFSAIEAEIFLFDFENSEHCTGHFLFDCDNGKHCTPVSTDLRNRAQRFAW